MCLYVDVRLFAAEHSQDFAAEAPAAKEGLEVPRRGPLFERCSTT